MNGKKRKRDKKRKGKEKKKKTSRNTERKTWRRRNMGTGRGKTGKKVEETVVEGGR